GLLAASPGLRAGMMPMIKTAGTSTNRTEMYTSVRSATELLEQEIGQAGKISLPPPPAGIAWVLSPPGVPAAAFGITPDQPVTLAVTFNVFDTTPANVPVPVLFE